MFRSTLFTLALSAFAALTLAAPNKAKRADDDGHDVGDDSVLHVNDAGLVNVDELAKDADLLNDLNVLSSDGN
ncbi:hypothetical protein VTP01DRAFT_6130 [Rhizomucor pusillus]|uniref:uncharacterized protein n=1 Tax=Rhizomucor pusillus TaxID=4840 RepID=UPI0037429172